MRRDEEVERAVAAFQRAVVASDQPKPTKSLQPVAVATEQPAPVPTMERSGRSSLNPPIRVRGSIDEYTAFELQELLRWVKSDGKLRTNDELADEMFAALPFARRGSKIEAALHRAIMKG
jgi:hypothetical protein